MSFTGNENHAISLQAASELTKNHRDNHPNSINGFYYSKSAIEGILNQSGCVGIRIYYGEDNSTPPVQCLVISGVKSNEDDICYGLLAEFGKPTPPDGGNGNPLNS